jgi:hypothetical protein
MPSKIINRCIPSTGDERGMLVYGYKYMPVIKGKKLKFNQAPSNLEGAF